VRRSIPVREAYMMGTSEKRGEDGLILPSNSFFEYFI